MYELSNKPTAIYSFSHALCKIPNAISELGFIAPKRARLHFST